MSTLTLPKSTTQTLAWQGWSIAVPAEWNPVKIDGDYDEGSLLLADLHAPRLGLRWKRAGKRGDSSEWAKRSLIGEVGKLAADEAKNYAMGDAADWSASRLYQDPDPPGRDVWVGHSRRSNRVLQIVHHAERRNSTFPNTLLPTVSDTATSSPHAWTVFDLTLTTPPGMRVKWYRLNAGDLALGLTDSTRQITVVRQIGPAELALARQPLSAWLTHLPATVRKLYRPIRETEPATLAIDDRVIEGLRGTLRRKRRLWWAWMVRPRQTVLAFHDAERDRLIAGQSSDEAKLRQVLATIGYN